MASRTKYNPEYREQLKRGFNASAIPSVFNPITEDQKQNALDARQHLIDQEKRKLFGVEDTED